MTEQSTRFELAAFAGSHIPEFSRCVEGNRESLEYRIEDVPSWWPLADRSLVWVAPVLRKAVEEFHSGIPADMATLFSAQGLAHLDLDLATELARRLAKPPSHDRRRRRRAASKHPISDLCRKFVQAELALLEALITRSERAAALVGITRERLGEDFLDGIAETLTMIRAERSACAASLVDCMRTAVRDAETFNEAAPGEKKTLAVEMISVATDFINGVIDLRRYAERCENGASLASTPISVVGDQRDLQ